MKKICIYLMAVSTWLGGTACDDFLTYEPSDAVDTETAFKTADDVVNGMYGVYYTLGTYRFLGRDVLAIGDLAADNAWMTGGSGHFNSIYQWTITDSDSYLDEIWSYGYQALDRAVRVINAGEKMLAEGTLSEEKKSDVKASVAQAYAAKALSHFCLANIFSLPYTEGNKSSKSIILVKDAPYVAFEEVKRSTLEETYQCILADIQSAKQDIDLVGSDIFRLNKAALEALEARVCLYMGNWNGAKTASLAAIADSKGELVMDAVKYNDMWATNTGTSEDIFVLAKSEDDNLSANSLNTLYGSYGGQMTSGLVSLFSPNDMRSQLFTGTGESVRGLKYKGLPSSAATSNIPVFRLPEMYLIAAEAKAQLNETDAVDYLFAVAQRNPDVTKTDIPTDKQGLLKFISEERRRELFQEGHRLYDMRRTGEELNRVGGNTIITGWYPANFCYPIPVKEVNASGLEQTDNWYATLPTISK